MTCTLLLANCGTSTGPTTATQPPSATEQTEQTQQLNTHANRAFAELARQEQANLNNSSPDSPSPQLPPNKPGDRPSWILNPPQQADFIFAVGAAPINGAEAIAIQRADEQAKLNLSASLRVNISGTNKSLEKLHNGSLSQSFNSQVQSQVAPRNYSGLTIAARYIDTDEDSFYSLAALHRHTALQQLQQQILDIDQQLLNANTAANNQALTQLRLALPALKNLSLRQQLAQQALDISGGQQSYPLPAQLQQLQTELSSLLDRISFQVSGMGNPQLQDQLIQTLTEQGIRITDSQKADINIHYRVDWRHIHKYGQHYQMAHSVINLRDKQGRTLSSFIQKAKGVSGDKALAKNKAQQQLAQQISASLAAQLLEAID